MDLHGSYRLLYTAVEFLFYSFVTPIVGFVLLKVLHSHFRDFFLTIYRRTVALIIAQGVSFFLNGLSALLRYCRVYKDIAALDQNSWYHVTYKIIQVPLEGVPQLVILLSVLFAVQEKARAIDALNLSIRS